MTFQYKDEKGIERIEHWDVYTDAYNLKYLHSRETNAVAYFTCDNIMFYFTAFYGNKKSLLYYFYLSAFKVLLSENQQTIKDNISIHMLEKKSFFSYLNDFTSPFYSFMKVIYTQNVKIKENLSSSPDMKIESNVNISAFKKIKQASDSKIYIDLSGINSFEYVSKRKNIHATRIS